MDSFFSEVYLPPCISFTQDTAPKLKLAYDSVTSDFIKSFPGTKLLPLQKQINLVSQDSCVANPLGPSFFMSVFVHGWLLCFSIFDRQN